MVVNEQRPFEVSDSVIYTWSLMNERYSKSPSSQLQSERLHARDTICAQGAYCFGIGGQRLRPRRKISTTPTPSRLHYAGEQYNSLLGPLLDAAMSNSVPNEAVERLDARIKGWMSLC